MKALGVELIGSEARVKEASLLARAKNIPVGNGEGHLPLFVDYQTDFDLSVLFDAFAVFKTATPVLEAFNARKAYGLTGIVRCGILGGLSESDIQTLASLGVKIAIDLRTKALNRETLERLRQQGVDYRSIPLCPNWVAPGTGNLSISEGVKNTYESYRRFLTQKLAIQEVLSSIENQHSLIFCSYGKDRTGLAIALAQKKNGIPMNQILIDYAISYWNLAQKYGEAMKLNLSIHYDKILSLSSFLSILVEE